eukprot:1127388-Pyramimonas_sp.AAC.1
MSERIWIDDLSQRVAGSRRHVRTTLIKGILSTVKEFWRLGLGISPKSVVTCSHHSDAVAVAMVLARRGVSLSAVLQS